VTLAPVPSGHPDGGPTQTGRWLTVEDNMSRDAEDLPLRYRLFCELEATIAVIELEDLTRDELIALLDAFNRIAPDREKQDRTNVLDYPRRRSAFGKQDSWTMFKYRVRCERERIGQLIGAEPAPPLPSNVTAISERRGALG